jgi:muramoyltetrapeptide carboxypeptidase
MSTLRFPRPLLPGDRIGVTSPSSGVGPHRTARLEASVGALRERGFEVVVGACMSGSGVVSAPKEQRAAELVAMLCDPTIAAVVPPWGGELAIDLLDQLDWDALAAADPTWLVGWSDCSTLLVALTLRVGWASLHGWNLMDSRYDAPPGLLHWVDLAAAEGEVTQRSPGRYAEGWGDGDPGSRTMPLDRDGSWSVLRGGDVDVSGRAIGGCLEVLSPMAGTPYADVPAFVRDQGDDGVIVYLEACEHGAYDVARELHGLRLAGWFEGVQAVLIGRTPAPDLELMTQHEAVQDALGMLEVPVLLDLEIGHRMPFLPLVNGAPTRVVVDGDRHEVTQTIGVTD